MLNARLFFIIQSSSIRVSIVLNFFFSLLLDLNGARTVNVCQLRTATILFSSVSSTAVNEMFVSDKRRNSPTYPCVRTFGLTFGVFPTHTLFSELETGGNMKRTINRMCIYCYCCCYGLSDLKSTLEVPHHCRAEPSQKKGRQEEKRRKKVLFISLIPFHLTQIDRLLTWRQQQQRLWCACIPQMYNTLAGSLVCTPFHITFICHSSKNYYRNEI